MELAPAPSLISSLAPDLIPSKDGSLNSFSHHAGEHYANMSEGAFSEKLSKHIAPACEFLRTSALAGLESRDLQLGEPKGLDFQKQDFRESSVRVLDLCLGLGYTALLSRALGRILAQRFSQNLMRCGAESMPAGAPHLIPESPSVHITSIEHDRSLLPLVGKIHGLDSAMLGALERGECVRIDRIYDEVGLQESVPVWLQILWGDVREWLENLLAMQKRESRQRDAKGAESRRGFVPESSPKPKHTAESRSIIDSCADFAVDSVMDYSTMDSRDSRDSRGRFDIIYQDPFSYEKCPQLWSAEHFSTLHALAKEQCLITTYATRSEIISAAQETGFLAYRYHADSSMLNQALNALNLQAHSPIPQKRKSSIFSKQTIHFATPRI